MSYFDFVEIKKNDPRIADVFKLRYKVYVEEWGFERPEDHPLGIESDDYDDQAIHVAAIRRQNASLIGSARLIMPSGMGFPIEEHMRIERSIPGYVRDTTCEISRLAVSKEYRRRAGDDTIYSQEYFDGRRFQISEDERRSGENDIVMGIFQTIAAISGANKLTHYYVVMARGLHVLLKRRKIHFSPVGPEIHYHGLRRPYFGAIEDILQDNEELLSLYRRGLSQKGQHCNLQDVAAAI